MTKLHQTLLASAIASLCSNAIAELPTYSVEEFNSVGFEPGVSLNENNLALFSRDTRFGPQGNIPNDDVSDILHFIPAAINNLNQVAGFNSFEHRLYIATPPYLLESPYIVDNVDAVYDFNDANDVLLSKLDSNVASIESLNEAINIGHLGGLSSTGVDINNKKQAVGFSSISTGQNHAFIFEGNSIQDLGTLGGAESYATAINENGIVVGYSDLDDGRVHGFKFENGQLHDLNQLSQPFVFFNSYALDINDHGIIVGYADGHCLSPNIGCIDRTEAFIIDKDSSIITNLNSLVSDDLGFHFEKAVAINNNGQILAEGVSDENGHRRTLLLTPEYSTVQPSMNARGTFNAWNTQTMYRANTNTWRTRVHFDNNSNSSFKFDVFGDWSTNWGDNNNDGFGDSHGANIPVDSNGIFDIKFFDNSNAYSAEKIGQRFEAENAELNGVQFANNHNGFSHNGFADYQNDNGDSLVQSVNTEHGGMYSLRIRYANGSPAPRHLELSISSSCCGHSESISFASTGTWDEWGNIVIDIPLSAGHNTVTLSTNGEAGPNVDFFEILKL